MKTSQELEAELVSLGNSAEEVAESLRKKGIKGKVKDSCYCPLAKFLTSVAGEPVSVGTWAGFCSSKGRPLIALPQACTFFITHFDIFSLFSDLREDT